MFERTPYQTHTFSKHPSRFPTGSPDYVECSDGPYAVSGDLDATQWIDHVAGLGPVIVGHAISGQIEAVCDETQGGVCHSMAHPLEDEVAELLVSCLTFSDPESLMVRFAKNGADVTSAAVRLARAATGRDLVVRCGYHGHHDWAVGEMCPMGVPAAVRALTASFDPGDLDMVEALLAPEDVSCVILEPLQSNVPEFETTTAYLQDIKALCGRTGTILIFDEMVSGFRCALGGAIELFGVEPDLVCYGKAVANGWPLSALVGRREIMELIAPGQVFFSTTFGAETSALAAARWCLNYMKDNDVQNRLAVMGKRLMAACPTAVGYPQRVVYQQPAAFGEALASRRHLFQGYTNLMVAHEQVIDKMVDDVAWATEKAMVAA